MTGQVIPAHRTPVLMEEADYSGAGETWNLAGSNLG